MLFLQTESRPVIILLSSLQGIGPTHKVAAVELDAGFSCPYFHEYAALISLHGGRKIQTCSLIGIQHKIVIIPFSEFQLLIVRIDPGADGGRLPEIERRA